MALSRRAVQLATVLPALVLVAGCYERGIVPDPNAPIPNYSFQDVIERFQQGDTAQRRTGNDQMVMPGFGPGFVPPDTEGDQSQGQETTGPSGNASENPASPSSSAPSNRSDNSG